MFATQNPTLTSGRTRFVRLFVIIAAALFVTACSDSSSRVTLRGATMGTSWSIIYADPGSVAAAELQSAMENELLAINQALSTYIPDSEISRFNAASGASPDRASADAGAMTEQELSPRFATVLGAALEVGELTDGAYDVTVGPLIELWGFGASAAGDTPPSASDVAAAAAKVGAHRLVWNAGTSSLARPDGYRVDLSSIAKGYAVDQLTSLLTDFGVTNSLVEIGGELRASGERPEGGPWRLAVESPDPGQRRFVEALSIRNAAVATSGDYRNFFEFEGRRYSHLVDPRTGYPVAHDLVSVTVIDESCMRADALATALIVLGFEAARTLAEAQGIAAHFVFRDGDALEVHYTSAFAPYRQSAAAAVAGESATLD